MTTFLLDEVFPSAAAVILRERFSRYAHHARELGLDSVADAAVADVARSHGWALVTENVADFVAERDCVLLFVLKRNLSRGGAQAAALATLLDHWAHNYPNPHPGQYWPKAV